MDPNLNDTEKCMYYQPTENVALSLILLNANLLTLAILAKYSWAMYCQVDISHPVFAVIFQDLLVLTLSKGLDSVIVISQETVQFLEMAEFIRLAVFTLAVNFHQVSWLTVMSMRYYLLIVVDDLGLVNMKRLRQNGVIGVWLISVPFTLLCQLPRYAVIKLYGWPEVELSYMPVSAVFLSSFSVWLFSNIPDFVSIGIFVAILKYFKQQQVERISPEFSANHQDEDYGGIWVGQEEQEIPQVSSDAISVITIDSNNSPNIQHEVGNETMQNNYNVQDNQVDEDLHKVTEVIKSLRLYVLTSLLDMLMIFTSFAACLPYSQLFMQVEILIGCFWIPLFVIVKNFPQLRKLFRCWN